MFKLAEWVRIFMEVVMRVAIRVSPNASMNQVVFSEKEPISIRLKSAPVDGKANQELIRFLSKRLSIPQKNFTIIQGKSSKNKLLGIEGLSEDVFWQRIFQEK